MNDLKTQNERLIKFAYHLLQMKDFPGQLFDEVELVELEERVRIHFIVKYHYLVIEELPSVFREFQYSEETGDPMLEGYDPAEGPIPSVIDFFGLTPDTFCHLFDVEKYQNIELYGGKILTEESQPADYAHNMLELVRSRMKK